MSRTRDSRRNWFGDCRMTAMMLVLVAAAVGQMPADAMGAEKPAKPAIWFLDGPIPKFKAKNEMIGAYGDRYGAFHAALMARNRAGEDLPCSSQILEEVGWRIKYTTDRAAVERRLADLEQSLTKSEDEQRFALEQTEAHGSWGACYEPWVFRAWASVDPLKELAYAGETPRYPLRFLDAVDTPEKIQTLLRDLIVSRVAEDGRNRRKELNLAVTALGQLLLLPKLAPFVDPEVDRQALAEAMIRVMDDEWQDPKTGYWGAWYEADGQIVKTKDLSITFHIVSYREGDVPRRTELVDTLFQTREVRYPYGWQDRGTQNTHHSYDVARLLFLVWPDLDEYRKARARAEIAIMLARTLRIALQPNGEFDSTPFNSVPEAYYFGVSMLDTVGYFDPAKQFWARGLEFERADERKESIIRQIHRLDSDAPMAKAALRKLGAMP